MNNEKRVMKKKIEKLVIEIPHLHATITVQDMKYLKGVEIKGGGFTCKGEEKERHNNYHIFFMDFEEMKKIPQNFPMIAHECLHAIQYIAEDYGIELSEEKEHGAYLLNYLLEELLK